MEQSVSEGDIVVDGTCGNGHDTLFLTKLVGQNGHVYGFDIQSEAINRTTQRLKDNGFGARATIYHDSHAKLKERVPPYHRTNIQAAIFNLGYLPGSDKTIVTTPGETIASIDSLLSLLNEGGVIVLVVYHGHPGGKEEKDAVLDYVTGLDQQSFRALQYSFINQKNNPPFILAVEKR